MASCPKLKTCKFYKNELIIDLGIGEYLKKQYCNAGNIEKCARNMVFEQVGAEYVEDTLFPNNVDKAIKIINRVKNKK